MSFLVLGDSISAGVGATKQALGYARLLHTNSATHWPAYHGLDLTTRRGQALPLRHLARSGATTEDVLHMLRRELAGGLVVQDHATVVMTVGGNDIKRILVQGGLASMFRCEAVLCGAALDGVLQRLRDIVALLRSPGHFPAGASLYLGTVYDPTDGEDAASALEGVRVPGFGRALETWSAAYHALGVELGFTVVDVLGAFRGHGFGRARAEGSNTSHWFADWIHPNDRGHHELRCLFYTAIARG